MSVPFADVDSLSGNFLFIHLLIFLYESLCEDLSCNLYVVDEYDMETPSGVIPPTDAKTLERISERSYIRDWVRLKIVAELGSNINKSKETFRLTQINCAYMMCRR